MIDGDSIRKDQKVIKQNEVMPLAANMDRPGDDRTKRKKSDRGRQIYDIAYKGDAYEQMIQMSSYAKQTS